MFEVKKHLTIIAAFAAGIICCTFFSSCEIYNFSRPQPIDKENIYEFPESFRGKWFSKNDGESLSIYKDRVRYLSGEYEEKIITSAWPRIDSNGFFTGPPFWGRSLYTINYDSLKRPIDTVSNYLLRGGYIYEISYDSSINNGKPYHRIGDTIYVAHSDSTWLDLGQNAFLRKLAKNMYTINILNRTIGMEDNNWWQVFIIEKNNAGSVIILGCNDKSEKLPEMFYAKQGNYYFDSNWTTEEMLQLIRKGYFSDSSVLGVAK